MNQYTEEYEKIKHLIQVRNEIGNLISEEIKTLEDSLNKCALTVIKVDLLDKEIPGIFCIQWDKSSKRLTVPGDGKDGGRALIECSLSTRENVFKNWNYILNEFIKNLESVHANP